MSKQIRVSDAVFNELKQLASEYDIDKRTFMNVSIVLIKQIVEHNAVTVELVSKDGSRTSMGVPLVFEKKNAD